MEIEYFLEMNLYAILLHVSIFFRSKLFIKIISVNIFENKTSRLSVAYGVSAEQNMMTFGCFKFSN